MYKFNIGDKVLFIKSDIPIRLYNRSSRDTRIFDDFDWVDCKIIDKIDIDSLYTGKPWPRYAIEITMFKSGLIIRTRQRRWVSENELLFDTRLIDLREEKLKIILE